MKSIVLLIVAFVSAIATPAMAYEATDLVTVRSIQIYSSGTFKFYYVLANQSWNFVNCPAQNQQAIQFNSLDAAAKEWLALLLTAKSTGAQIKAYVDDCTAPLSIAQLELH